MDTSAAVVLAVLAALVLANLPFLAGAPKGTALRLAKFLVLYCVWIAFCTVLAGSLPVAEWSLWPVSLAFFAVLAFPGVTWRYLWHARRNP
ncbi:DUF2818 family protein [Noviherbaspirillum sp.]|uniref:DUF2818 family protein n=1 Tax=Noviherbaspirillum sp. TaxID=1926288 RepID=UPI002D341603|nr:DUF2818 family protein [Noviherbaspirillum sp.]HZW20740.1 DUF2818 family protein [Noviherbaspirillum sp.]